MIIKAMKDENVSDWFNFIDNRAFADHQDWKGCYCTGPFTPRLNEYASKIPVRKEYAKWLIEHGRMQGYLAVESGKMVGWCNVNLKSALPKYNDFSKESESILSITCFMVQKEYRRKGIAPKLLGRIIKDAREKGKCIPTPGRSPSTGKWPFGKFRTRSRCDLRAVFSGQSATFGRLPFSTPTCA